MNKTWSVVLIVLACLVVLGGTYWYIAMRPQTGEPEQVEQVSTQPAEAVVQPPIQPVFEEEPKPDFIAEPVQQEVQAKASPVVQEIPVTEEEPIAEIPIEQPDLTNTAPLPPPIDPLLMSGLLKLPVSSAPKVPIPFAPEQPLVKASVKEEEPVVEQQEPGLEEIPVSEESAEPIAMQGGDEGPPEVPRESEKVVLTPMAPQTPPIPTTRVEIDPEPLSWTIGTAVSFANFDLPALTNNGFSVQLDVLKHTDTLFSFGGALEYARDGSENQLSVLAKGQWTLRKDEAFTIPLSISLGPTFFFGTSTDFGLTAKVLGGFSYEIVENLRFFYQAGIQAQWVITSPDFRFSFEPMRIGFSYSF